jgi:hypothetical protein
VPGTEARPRVQPVFDAIGHRIIRAGQAGAGTRLKLVTNSWGAGRSRGGRRDDRAGRGTAGGVDVKGSSKKELMDRAAKLGIRGRSTMTKQELGEAIVRKQD